MRRLAAFAVSFAILGGAALGGTAYADTPNGTTGTASAPNADPNEVVCKQGDVITGSRFPGPKICHRRLEWEQIQHNSNELINSLRDSTDSRNW